MAMRAALVSCSSNPSYLPIPQFRIEDSVASSVFEDARAARGTASVVIGEENVEESLKNYSVVFSDYGTSDTAEGMIGIIAPTRMEYGIAIPAVRYLASDLDKMTMMFYGG